LQEANEAIRELRALRQKLGAMVEGARSQELTDVQDLEAILRQLDSDIAQAEATPKTMGNYDLITTSHSPARETDILEKWHARSLGWALHYCYAPDDPLPWFGASQPATLRSLYDGWAKGRPVLAAGTGPDPLAKLEGLLAIERITTSGRS